MTNSKTDTFLYTMATKQLTTFFSSCSTYKTAFWGFTFPKGAKGICLTCSSLSVFSIWLNASLSLFLPLSPAEPSGPAREPSTGVFIPAVICASISSKLLQNKAERSMHGGVFYMKHCQIYAYFLHNIHNSTMKEIL